MTKPKSTGNDIFTAFGIVDDGVQDFDPDSESSRAGVYQLPRYTQFVGTITAATIDKAGPNRDQSILCLEIEEDTDKGTPIRALPRLAGFQRLTDKDIDRRPIGYHVHESRMAKELFLLAIGKATGNAETADNDYQKIKGNYSHMLQVAKRLVGETVFVFKVESGEAVDKQKNPTRFLDWIVLPISIAGSFALRGLFHEDDNRFAGCVKEWNPPTA